MRILIVDDEANVRKSLRIALESMQNSVEEAVSPSDAAKMMKRAPSDVAFVDLRLRNESGLDLLETLTKVSPGLAVVIITAYASIDSAVEAMRRGAFDYLPKPFTPPQIRAVLERLDRVRSLQNQIADLQARAGVEAPEVSLECGDPQVRAVLEQCRQVASTDAAVLIRGESGTGKGVLARAIHAWSHRSQARFVTVSCPSLSAELLASELFGHARGSFTGAIADTEGTVAAAEGGTLFLDEIGDLPLPLQPKLLRFLQERQYERLGENRTRTSNARIIAASNRDLDALAASGQLREDLLFRLNVVELTLPPVRVRSDRADLATHLLAFFARQIGKPIEGFSQEAHQAILSYSWPGNLREMRNAIERAVIFASGTWIGLSDLPGRIAAARSDSAAGSAAAIQVGAPVSLEQLEGEHIRLLLERCPSREEAARILGIDPSTLYRKRRHLGL
jgi:NtrC-family two-component system response regulator AlgB